MRIEAGFDRAHLRECGRRPTPDLNGRAHRGVAGDYDRTRFEIVQHVVEHLDLRCERTDVAVVNAHDRIAVHHVAEVIDVQIEPPSQRRYARQASVEFGAIAEHPIGDRMSPDHADASVDRSFERIARSRIDDPRFGNAGVAQRRTQFAGRPFEHRVRTLDRDHDAPVVTVVAIDLAREAAYDPGGCGDRRQTLDAFGAGNVLKLA